MVETRGSASEEPAARTFNEAAGTASPRGMDPESFTYEEKESYVRFAPFMGMRSCQLEPRSEMPWTSTTGRDHACMMVTVRVADFGRAAPPSRGGGALVRAAGENFAREGVKMVIFH